MVEAPVRHSPRTREWNRERDLESRRKRLQAKPQPLGARPWFATAMGFRP
jgi:hypothetical protein